MGIILLSGLCQDGTARLRLALLRHPRDFIIIIIFIIIISIIIIVIIITIIIILTGWVGGSLFTAPLAETKQEKSVLHQLGIYSGLLYPRACVLSHQEYIIFASFTFVYHNECYE